MNKLSVSTEPLVSTFAMLAISPNASNSTDRLDASSKTYKILVSSFSMDENWRIGDTSLLNKAKKATLYPQ
jgi:hypothetical protein